MLRGMYDWTLRLGSTRHAVWVLAAVAFVESSVFPIPPDVLLIPMVLAVRQRAWMLAGICTAASVLGGFLGYAIGALLFDAIGHDLAPVKTKRVLDEVGLGWLREHEPEAYARYAKAITAKPGRVSVVVK